MTLTIYCYVCGILIDYLPGAGEATNMCGECRGYPRPNGSESSEGSS